MFGQESRSLIKPNRMRQYTLALLVMGLISLTMVTGCETLDPIQPISVDHPTPVLSEQASRPDVMSVSEIQGAGHISPYDGQSVSNVHGIVTAITPNGFYLQSRFPDDNPATSDGIFVFTGIIPKVSVGDEVLVDAAVEEYLWDSYGSGNLTITQLVYPAIEVLSSRNPLPEPVVIGIGGRMPPTEVIDAHREGLVGEGDTFDPFTSGIDFYESLEGMLVQVNQAVVVGATNPYGEIVILPDAGSWAGVRTPRGGIVITEEDFNPERIILDDAFHEMPLVKVGDYSTAPIIGVLDYTFGNYKLQPIHPVEFADGGLSPDEPLEPAVEGQLRVASYNVFNLSAPQKVRFPILADQIVNLMGAPDIIGLQEIEDNDGNMGQLEVAADRTYQAIIDAVAEIGGPPYAYVNIDPVPLQDGGVFHGNIRVGFLYRLDKGIKLADAPHGDAVSAVSVMEQNGQPVISLNPGRIDPENPAFSNNRKPLVATFIRNGKPIFIINNHFTSKRGDSPLFGVFQPPLQSSEVKRMQQAQIVHDFVASILAIDPDSRVIVLGDLNDFHFSEPVRVLKGDLLTNLIETLPEGARYTYNYQGNSQVLDHILVSGALNDNLVSFDILHINSEFDYQTQFSDHEPLVATFWWE